jgi:hypothetical protein
MIAEYTIGDTPYRSVENSQLIKEDPVLIANPTVALSGCQIKTFHRRTDPCLIPA